LIQFLKLFLFRWRTNFTISNKTLCVQRIFRRKVLGSKFGTPEIEETGQNRELLREIGEKVTKYVSGWFRNRWTSVSIFTGLKGRVEVVFGCFGGSEGGCGCRKKIPGSATRGPGMTVGL
jgi:hypothetical protein